MTLKTTKEQRDELLANNRALLPYAQVSITLQMVHNLCHDADRAEELEKELAQCMEALTAARKGQPFGPIVGAQTIINQQREIADLRAKLDEALRRMDRTREILTGGTPTPDRNWGALDTSDLRALKEQEKV